MRKKNALNVIDCILVEGVLEGNINDKTRRDIIFLLEEQWIK